MLVLATLENLMIQGFRNGMSIRQVQDRVPALAARQLKISEADLHQHLENEAGPFDRVLHECASRIASQLTPAEKAQAIR